MSIRRFDVRTSVRARTRAGARYLACIVQVKRERFHTSQISAANGGGESDSERRAASGEWRV